MSEALKLAELLARTPRILVVDDEESVRMAFERLSRYYDLDITTATSPTQGLDLVANEPPYDAIFVDMKFPAAMSGMDIIRALNTTESPSSVIIMSGSINLHDVMTEANQLGVVSFMIKPIALTTQLLVSVLKRIKVRLMPKHDSPSLP